MQIHNKVVGCHPIIKFISPHSFCKGLAFISRGKFLKKEKPHKPSFSFNLQNTFKILDTPCQNMFSFVLSILMKTKNSLSLIVNLASEMIATAQIILVLLHLFATTTQILSPLCLPIKKFASACFKENKTI